MVAPSREPNGSFPLGAAATAETLFEGYRRVALEIDSRALDLLASDDALAPQGVHALRVSTKRLRAIWQLLKPTENAALAKGAIHRLRDQARTLAGQRDHQVLASLLRELAESTDAADSGDFAKAAVSLVSPPDLRAAGGDPRLGFLAMFDLDGQDWQRAAAVTDAALLEAGLGRSYAKTRELGRIALRDREPEILHRWRRWVKYLRYQLEPLVTREREFIDMTYAELKHLGSILGRRNDLHNLQTALRDSGLQIVLSAVDVEDAHLEAQLPIFGDSGLRFPPRDFLDEVRHDLARRV